MHKSNQSRRKLVDQKAIALDRVEQEILHVARCAEMLRSMFTMQGIGKGKGGGKRHLSKLMPISDQPDQPGDAAAEWATEESVALQDGGTALLQEDTESS